MSGACAARELLTGWGASVSVLGGCERDGWLVSAELAGCRVLVAEQRGLGDAIGSRQINLSCDAAGRAHTDLNVLWFIASGAGAEDQARQIVDALYGAARIFDKRSKFMKPCYFFGESVFQQAAQQFDGARQDGASLDGAIVVCTRDDAIAISLCLNTYSRRWQLLRDSPYARQASVSIKDPQAEEARGAAYLVDAGARRGDAAAMLRYVEDKYELERAMNMDSNVASAAPEV